MKIKFFLSVLILLSLLAVSAAAQGKRITEEEAIQIAEEFVERNGNTDLPPGKKSRNSFEFRYKHELIPKAIYIFERSSDVKQGWTAVFRLSWGNCPECDNSENYRAVTMDEYGHNLRISQKPYRFRK